MLIESVDSSEYQIFSIELITDSLEIWMKSDIKLAILPISNTMPNTRNIHGYSKSLSGL